jgi:hypothetical protein
VDIDRKDHPMTELHMTPRGTGFALLTALGVTVSLTTGALGEGSEVPDEDTAIESLPFVDTGDTSDNDDNFDAVCPYPGSIAPDVFYAIRPTTDIMIDITLCGSDYDTKLYVLDAVFTVIACNDDFCEDPEGVPTFRSELQCVELTAGDLFYIAVDGFTEMGEPQSGPYLIEVTECEPPPPFNCPKAASPEGESCDPEVEDVFNGGCNSVPPVFSPIECGDVICGDSWALGDGGFRDTDWYEIVVEEETTFTLRGEFAYETGILGVIFMSPGSEGSGDCDEVLGTNPFVRGDPGEIVSVTSDPLPPGTHWFFVAPDAALEVICGDANDYWFELTCETESSACIGDLDDNGEVEVRDLVDLLANWGPCPK